MYNRDSVIILDTPLSGKIRFWVKCTENAININSLSIRSASGGSSVFTMDSYQLVTDVNQLQDSDQVIFGVYKNGVNYIMGYFDEWESVNNIHAIPGKYSADRNTVNADDRAIYTLRIADLNGQTAYIFQDELRYEEAYLVASGGKTKNRLALWTDIYDEKTYGYYGLRTEERQSSPISGTVCRRSFSIMLRIHRHFLPVIRSVHKHPFVSIVA